MTDRGPGIPNSLRYRERVQHWTAAQICIKALYGSRSGSYVQSVWYQVDRLRDLAGGTVVMPTVAGDKTTSAIAEKFDRFKKTTAIIGVSQTALNEILDEHENLPTVAIASRNGSILAGVLPNGLRDLAANSQAASYEIGLRTGYFHYRAGIGVLNDREAILPQHPNIWVANSPVSVRDFPSDHRFT